jgi:pyruvate dehydrogenase (quinone)
VTRIASELLVERLIDGGVDVVVNPDEPPMPPKIRYDQAEGFAEAFRRGQPRRASITATLSHDRLDQMRS